MDIALPLLWLDYLVNAIGVPAGKLATRQGGLGATMKSPRREFLRLAGIKAE
jgi:hypothetical protein